MKALVLVRIYKIQLGFWVKKLEKFFHVAFLHFCYISGEHFNN